MKKLYIVTETDEGESHQWLADKEPKSCNRKGYSLESREATRDEITLDMMVSAVEGELENANHHREIYLPGWLCKVLLKNLPEDKVKEIFYAMIEDKGLLWEE